MKAWLQNSTMVIVGYLVLPVCGISKGLVQVQFKKDISFKRHLITSENYSHEKAIKQLIGTDQQREYRKPYSHCKGNFGYRF